MYVDLPKFESLNLAPKNGQKTVLLRVDFNIADKNGELIDTFRLKAHLPTITELHQQGYKVVLLCHRGRPKGHVVPTLSNKILVKPLEKILGQDIIFVPDTIGRMAEQAIAQAPPNSIILLENLRFYKEEITNDPTFAKQLAKLGDAYVNDAFATCHRPHASIIGLPHYLPSAAGHLLRTELNRIHRLLHTPDRPLVMVIGGGKLALKLDVLRHAIFKANQIMVGGALANTLLAAKDVHIGRSVLEPDYIETMRDLLVEAGIVGCRLLLPQDAVVAKSLQPNLPTMAKNIEHIAPEDMILDIGPETLKVWSRVIQQAKTVIWNGPVGAYEISPFEEGTLNLANAILHSETETLASGGDTLAALKTSGLRDKFNMLSSAGAAFLEVLAGRDLHGVKALHKAANPELF